MRDIVYLEKIIKAVGGYVWASILTGIVAGIFIISTMMTQGLFSMVMGLFFTFILGYCWIKDTEHREN